MSESQAGLLTAIPVRNVWHMLLYLWESEYLYDETQLEAENSPALDALLASILCKLLERRLRRGLGRSYREMTDIIGGIRGRIAFAESTRRRLFERGQACCSFFDLTSDIPRNQIVKAVFRRAIAAGDFGPNLRSADALRHRLRANVRLLGNVRDVEPSPAVIALETFSHGDHDYRLMLNIAGLLLRRLMPAETVGSGSLLALRRESVTLFKLFEGFVAKFYQQTLVQWNVVPQSRQSWHLQNDVPEMPYMIPDLRLTHRILGTIILLDTKYYLDVVESNQGASEKFHSAHLYQMYSYLRTQEHLSAAHDSAMGILLYPAVNLAVSRRLDLPTKKIQIETIDLSLPWADIEKSLLSLILRCSSDLD